MGRGWCCSPVKYECKRLGELYCAVQLPREAAGSLAIRFPLESSPSSAEASAASPLGKWVATKLLSIKSGTIFSGAAEFRLKLNSTFERLAVLPLLLIDARDRCKTPSAGEAISAADALRALFIAICSMGCELFARKVPISSSACFLIVLDAFRSSKVHEKHVRGNISREGRCHLSVACRRGKEREKDTRGRARSRQRGSRPRSPRNASFVAWLATVNQSIRRPPPLLRRNPPTRRNPFAPGTVINAAALPMRYSAPRRAVPRGACDGARFRVDTNDFKTDLWSPRASTSGFSRRSGRQAEPWNFARHDDDSGNRRRVSVFDTFRSEGCSEK